MKMGQNEMAVRTTCTAAGDREATYHLQDPKRGQQRCRHAGLAGGDCERVGGGRVERHIHVWPVRRLRRREPGCCRWTSRFVRRGCRCRRRGQGCTPCLARCRARRRPLSSACTRGRNPRRVALWTPASESLSLPSFISAVFLPLVNRDDEQHGGSQKDRAIPRCSCSIHQHSMSVQPF